MQPQILSKCAHFCTRRLPVYMTLGRNSLSAERKASQSSVDAEEVQKFTSTASDWWSDSYRLLRSMNRVRVPLVRDGILSMSQRPVKDPHPLKGYKIIDIGCGGGILSEPLARLGASVTGLDPGQENIEAAIEHASKDMEIKDRLTYVCDTVENVAKVSSGQYDAVVCSEVIEHVADVPSFVNCCVEITKDGGSIFFTTINRTMLSYALAIVGAEYMLKIIPRGTHDWNKFITPKELSDLLLSLNCRVVSVEGTAYNPITQKWMWTGSYDTFYALHACK